MSKIHPFYEREKESLKIPWLIDFVNKLEKKGSDIDYLKDLFVKKDKFLTIDEKMADIRERIGFELIEKVSEELDKNTKSASKSCNCDDCSCKLSTAQQKHKESDVKRMEKVLDYIDQILEAEEDIDVLSVISRCRDEDSLMFDQLRINMSKLKDYISKNVKVKDSSNEKANYISYEFLSTDELENNLADYFRLK